MLKSLIEMKKLILAEKVKEILIYEAEIQSLNSSLENAKEVGDIDHIRNIKGLLTMVTEHLVKINGMIDVLENDIEFITVGQKSPTAHDTQSKY